MKERLEKTFLDLIHINEVYGEEKEVIRYVTNVLEELSIPYKIDDVGNVIGYMSGDGDPVMLNTHMDTPESTDKLAYHKEGDVIRSTGEAVLGADPKSGLAVLLELAKYLSNQTKKHRPIEFVFTIGEEAGLIGARNLDYSLLQSKMGLVIDEDGPCTNIVTQAPGYYRVDAEIVGKTAHSRDWREGVNALEITAKAISELRQGEVESGVTLNIGTLQAGTARNSVAGRASFQSELRSFDNEKLSKAGKNIEESVMEAVKQAGASILLDSGLEFEAYAINTEAPLFRQLEKTYKKMDTSPHYYETFGGSDANIFNAHGIDAVAVGSAYYLAHRYDEYVNVAEMQDLLDMLALFVTDD